MSKTNWRIVKFSDEEMDEIIAQADLLEDARGGNFPPRRVIMVAIREFAKSRSKLVSK